MPNSERTPEEVQRTITAAFDSVGLIDRIIAGEDMVNQTIEERKNTVERNVGHLNIQLNDQEIVDGMTPEQLTEMQAAVTNGNLYIAEN